MFSSVSRSAGLRFASFRSASRVSCSLRPARPGFAWLGFALPFFSPLRFVSLGPASLVFASRLRLALPLCASLLSARPRSASLCVVSLRLACLVLSLVSLSFCLSVCLSVCSFASLRFASLRSFSLRRASLRSASLCFSCFSPPRFASLRFAPPAVGEDPR